MMPVSCRTTLISYNLINDFAHRLVGEIDNAYVLRITYCVLLQGHSYLDSGKYEDLLQVHQSDIHADSRLVPTRAANRNPVPPIGK